MQILANTSQTKRKQLLRLLVIGIAVVAALILAAGLSRIELLPGRPFPVAGILQAISSSNVQLFGRLSLPAGVINLVAGCLWLLLLISIIAFIISPEVRRGVLRRLIIYLIWFLLVYSLIRALQNNLPFFALEPLGPSESLPSDIPDPAELMPTPPDFILDPPSWIVYAVSILLIAILLSFIWLTWRLLAVRKKNRTTLEKLTQEAQQALEGLQAGADLKDTVTRCYYEMGHILSSRYNLHRTQGMTAREFEHYLVESGLKDRHIKQLTRLFERVRYGRTPPGKQEEQAAMACLTAIVLAYGQP